MKYLKNEWDTVMSCSYGEILPFSLPEADREEKKVTWCLWCTTASLELSLTCPIIENDRRQRPAKALTLYSDNHLPIHFHRDRWEETTSELQLTVVPPQNALFIFTCFYPSITTFFSLSNMWLHIIEMSTDFTHSTMFNIPDVETAGNVIMFNS